MSAYKEIKDLYLVVGALSYGQRTRLASMEGAVNHARQLLVNDGTKPGQQLFVVKIVAMVEVERPDPPIRTTYIPD